MATAIRHAGGVSLVPGTRPGRVDGAVVAAVDDDANPGPVLAYAAAQARTRGVPLRLVHVWAEDRPAPGVRLCRHDRMSDADRLLAGILHDHLPEPEAAAAERQILHDPDPVRALLALSAEASLLVVGVGGGPDPAGAGAPTPAGAGAPTPAPARAGATTRALAGRTACPLAVVPGPEGPADPVPSAW